MEGITHGIRPGSPRKVKIKIPVEEPKEQLTNKALRIQAKYGVTPLSEKKKEEPKSKEKLKIYLLFVAFLLLHF